MRSDLWTDRELLEALDMRDRLHMTRGQIAAKLLKSRSGTIAMLARIDRDEEGGAAHLDGTLGPRWWVDGLLAQAERAAA